MESFSKIVADITAALWGWPTIILLLGTHIFLTVRLRFPQLQIFKAIKLSVTKDKDSSGDVSQFGALATSLAATIGTGNIIGVATAIALGGPGAVLWCWITGVFGIATKYSEGLLAIKYRVKTSDGTMLGGPMYALERGLKMKWLAVIFCIFTAIAALGIGNTVQANAISTLLAEPGLFGEGFMGIPTWLSGLVCAAVVALVIIFGVKGIANVCGALVPFMAVFYVIGCLIIIGLNWEFMGETISLIVNSAINPEAAGGGFIGGTIMMAARFGIARGLFSNESGMGSAPIVAAAAQTRNPVRQALVSSTATFWDTVVVCALTGLVLVSSIIAYPDISYSDGAKLTQAAFGKIPYVGSIILTVGLVTFAFSTILGWSYYAEKAIEYLAGKKTIYVYRGVWVVLVFVGAVVDLSLVWNIADGTNALMAIPNLISLLLLSGVVVAETRKYLWNKRLDDYDTSEIPEIDD
ncbi:MAG: alanine:cation symporter family protein [Bacteroidales bacterium]|nr:alanine:cation symporter family protein [Bacteroidales bacterium]MBQ8034850.1 alanine:cation symporter family protein [Bacteroidales bacterium]